MDDRRKALYVASAGALLGTVLIALFQYFRPALDSFAAREPDTTATIAVWGLFAFVVMPVIGMALYLWRTRRTSLRAFAAALAVTGIGMTYVLWRLAQLI